MRARHLNALTVLLIACAGISEARAEPAAAPPALTDAQRAIFFGSKEDVLTRKPCKGFRAKIMMNCRDDRHYVRMNEWYHQVWKPYLDNIRGGHVGIASDQNLTFIAWARSEWAWLLDYDPVVVWVNKVHRAFFRASKTRKALLALWERKNRVRARKILEKEYAGDKELKQILKAYRFYRVEIGGTFKRIVSGRATKAHWLQTKSDFDYLRALYLADRIRVMKGDLLKGGTVTGIGDAARKLGVTIRSIYTSNAEEFWGPYPQTFRKAFINLPMDDKTVLLRTRHTSRYGPRIGSYVYIVQGGKDFQKRLADPKTRRVNSMMEHRKKGRPGFFTIGIPVRPESFLPKKKRRRRPKKAKARKAA